MLKVEENNFEGDESCVLKGNLVRFYHDPWLNDVALF
jgi:hypothetical protein